MSFPGRPAFGLPGFAAVPGAMAGGGPFNPHMPGGVFVPATQVGLISAPPGGIIARTAASMHLRNNQPPPIPPKPAETKEPEKSDGGPEAPKTTVFVGNISEKAPDVLIRQLLARCGIVLNWKRVQGASGNLQAFGFCEYKEPENTLRAIRLLHELTLGDKNLLVKVDAKTRALLDTYLSEKNKLKGKEDDKSSSEEDIDDRTRMEDERIKLEMNKLIIDYKAVLNKPPRNMGRTSSYTPFSSDNNRDENKKMLKKPKEQRDEKIDDLEMEDDKKQIISREIDRFRLTHKDETDRDSSKEREGEKESSKSSGEKERRRDRDGGERERPRERDRDRDRDRERERERRKERERREQEERERERDRLRREREKRERAEEERERERERRRERKKKKVPTATLR